MTETIAHIAIASPVDRLFDYLVPPQMLEYLSPGIRVSVSFGHRTVCGIVVSLSQESSLPLEKLATIQGVLDTEPTIDSAILNLCQWLARYYQAPLGEALMLAVPNKLRTPEPAYTESTFWRIVKTIEIKATKKQQWVLEQLKDGPVSESALTESASKAILKRLETLGVIESFKQITETSSPNIKAVQVQAAPHPLNFAQSQALETIAYDGHRTYLLEGITGSGKTEVYLQSIAEVIKRGKQALVLVPEIGLTPQTLKRFEQRFGQCISLLHSQMTPNQRLQQWQTAKHNAIIIGTRSAIFTPIPKLGLIIVDEEHDASYKQAEGIYYHARDLAIIRASQANIPIILGSATPSLESIFNLEHKDYVHLPLTERATASSLPETRIIEGQDHDISPEIRQAIAGTLDNGYQVLVFINRRGFAPTLLCTQCQWMSECTRCDSRMTLHRNPPKLQCHYCDYQQAPPSQCPQCHSHQLQPMGQGTQKSELMLESEFPHTPVIRIDRDNTRNKGQLDEALNKVNQGEPCILVGTQMLAKGHHFAKVNLVVILGADNGLFSTDFRGSERMGQQLTQVAGRAGRESHHGQVLIQSQFCDHPLLIELTQQGYASFARKLLEARRQSDMPPFTHIAMIRADAKQASICEQFLRAVRAEAESLMPASVHMRYLGPMAQQMGRRNHRYFYYLQIKSHSRQQRQQLLQQLRPFMNRYSRRQGLRWHIDVDPIENS